MAQWVKWLLLKPERLSSTLSHMHMSRGRAYSTQDGWSLCEHYIHKCFLRQDIHFSEIGYKHNKENGRCTKFAEQN